MKISVLLIEDEDDWIKIITGWLGTCDRINLMGCEKEESRALSILQMQIVDIVLLDLCLRDGMEGIELAEKINKVSDAKIIILTSIQLVQNELFSGGISGYLYKNQLDILCSTIEDVFDGNYPYEQFFREYKKYRVMLELSTLTHAEKDVLKHLLEGNMISQIGTLCHVSENTIKNQISSIYRKLDIHERGRQRREKLIERYSEALKYL